MNETMSERCKICNEARVKNSDFSTGGRKGRKNSNTTTSRKKKRKERGNDDEEEDEDSKTNHDNGRNKKKKKKKNNSADGNPYDVFVRRVRWHFRTLCSSVFKKRFKTYRKRTGTNPAAFDEFASTLSSFKIGRITQVEEACNRIRVLLRNSKGLMSEFRKLVLEG